MKKLFIIITLLFAGNLYAQKMMLRVNTDSLRIPEKRGQNMAKFVQGYIAYNQIVPYHDFLKVKPLNSLGFDAGVRYKFKLFSLVSLNGSLGYGFKKYRMADGCSRIYMQSAPICYDFDKEKVKFNSLTSDFAIRFNLDPRRGNIIGKYIDLGVRADYIFVSKYVAENKFENQSAEKVTTIYKGLKTVNPFNYSAMARVGKNRYALYATFRLSDIASVSHSFTDVVMSELPRLNVGLEFSIY